MLVNKQVIFAKTEAVYGVDPVGTAALNSILVENLSWSNESLRMNERAVVKPTFGKLAHIYGGTMRSLTFDVELKGGGKTGIVVKPPEIDPLLTACGLAKTTTGSVIAFDPASKSLKSVFLEFYMDGSVFKLSGAMGSFSLNMEAGAIPKLSFTLTGHYEQMSVGVLPSPTYSSVVPSPAVDIDWKIVVGTLAQADVAVGINTLTLDMGNVVSLVPDMGASDGFGNVQITDRDITGTIDPESLVYTAAGAVDAIFRDPMKTLQDGTFFRLDAILKDGTVGQEINIRMTKCSLREVSSGDREGVQTYDFSFGCGELAGDDAIKIEFK